MRANILVIEDEKEIRELITMYLEKEGFDVKPCFSAESGLLAVQKNPYDLVLLDINLPEMDGFEFLQELRRISEIPVIIISAREADEDLITGLSIGADEFVTKPFSPKVLVARVRAILRRMRHLNTGKKNYLFGDYVMDIEGYLLKKGDEKIALSSKEFDVLKLLVENAGKTMTPEMIYNEAWGNRYGDLTAVAVYIQRIRKKLGEQSDAPRFLQTVHGKGYRFNSDGLARG